MVHEVRIIVETSITLREGSIVGPDTIYQRGAASFASLASNTVDWPRILLVVRTSRFDREVCRQERIFISEQ